MELILIKPYGFDISEKSVRRAGLDYWKYVALSEHDTWQDFLETRSPDPEHVFFFEEFGKRSIFEVVFPENAFLVFGRETKGLPVSLISDAGPRLVHLPMRSNHIRSLNLANAVTAAAYQVLRGAF